MDGVLFPFGRVLCKTALASQSGGAVLSLPAPVERNGPGSKQLSL